MAGNPTRGEKNPQRHQETSDRSPGGRPTPAWRRKDPGGWSGL